LRNLAALAPLALALVGCDRSSASPGHPSPADEKLRAKLATAKNAREVWQIAEDARHFPDGKPATPARTKAKKARKK
jgi:hypothetical protein